MKAKAEARETFDMKEKVIYTGKVVEKTCPKMVSLEIDNNQFSENKFSFKIRLLNWAKNFI